MQFTVLALREGDDPNPRKERRLVKARDMLLVTAEPVQALRQRDIDLA
ncbi:MAG: hypothetical protein JWR00_77 [Rubritepida sp.]|nr:hypothetical protein [Rubritepida sp.]